jgi:hypothetical protein
MKPAYAKIAQRLALLEAQLKPQALQLMAFVQRATDIDALKAELLKAHLDQTPEDTGRPIDWLVISWSDKPTEATEPLQRVRESKWTIPHSTPAYSAPVPACESAAAVVAPTTLPVERIEITVRNPVTENDPGETAEGFYVVDGDMVGLTDAAGLPIGQPAWAKPGTERRVAGQLLRASLKPDDDFSRRLVNPPIGGLA